MADADEVASSAESHEAGLGIRKGGDRRHGDRRSRLRLRGNRRRGDRRRAGLHGLLFTAAAFAIPNQMTPAKVSSAIEAVLSPALEPRVGVSIDSFNPIPAAHAYDNLIREAAEKYRLDPSLIRSVMRTESAFNPFAVSTAGAMGLMQLMPEIQKAFGVDDPFDPRQNIMGGARLLRELLDQHHGNLVLTIASYNAGPTAIAKHGNKVPPFRETQNYVKRVTRLMADDERAAADDLALE
jgi:soluble lytic murein transglycosylase-like protein